VQVSLGNMAALRVDMQIGETTQSVEVQASAAAVEVNTAEVARSVSSGEMAELPVLSRNPADLLQLSPGVPAVTQDKNGSSTVGGLRPRSTTYNVDGSSNNFEVSSGPRTPVILEAVEEVRAVTNVFSAQYGKGSGAVVDMVIKSGTNQVHGSLFEYHRNRALDATPFFNNATGTGKPPFILNIYGATIGGPVIRDRTFFFAAYQGTNLRTQALERLNLPPDSLRSPILNDPRSLASDPAIGSVIRDVFARMPSCEGPGNTYLFNSNQARPSDESIGTLKSTTGSTTTICCRFDS
jgi:hypothetical protein